MIRDRILTKDGKHGVILETIAGRINAVAVYVHHIDGLIPAVDTEYWFRVGGYATRKSALRWAAKAMADRGFELAIN